MKNAMAIVVICLALFPVAQLAVADGSLVDLIEQVNEPLVLGYLEDVVAFGPRVVESWENLQAGAYLYDQFESMGLDVRFHHWHNIGHDGRNVEATIRDSSGSNDEIFIICSHYDTVPGSPGADDNGSGTAAVLALADILRQYSFDCTIRFICFDGEEYGLLGSKVYAKEAYLNGDNIIGVLNADMIGFAKFPYDETQIRVYNDTASTWLVDLVDTLAHTYYDYIDLNVIPSGYRPGSDHEPFWNEGYHALAYTENSTSDYYHLPGDTIATLNIPYLTKCTKLLIASVGELTGNFDPLPLVADQHGISYQTGGAVNFRLFAGTDNANRNYILLGGVTGSDPGTPLPGGMTNLPVNWDVFTDIISLNLNSPVFANFLGKLDGNGEAFAQLNTYGPLPPSALYVEMYYAYACNGPWDFASNVATVKIVD